MHSLLDVDKMDAILDEIERNPDSYNQNLFVSDCGTKFCIAGWAAVHKFKSEGVKLGCRSYSEIKHNADQIAVHWLMKKSDTIDVTRDLAWRRYLWDNYFGLGVSLEDIYRNRNKAAVSQGLVSRRGSRDESV